MERPKFKDLMNCKFTQDGDLDLSKSWWGYTSLGRKFVRFRDVFDSEKADGLEEKFDDNGAYIEAYIIFSVDKETNYDSADVDEYFTDDFPKMNAEEEERLEKIAYDTDGYKFTELD